MSIISVAEHEQSEIERLMLNTVKHLRQEVVTSPREKISWTGKGINLLRFSSRALTETSCLLSRQKKVKKRGKCHNMFCMVGNRIYINQVRTLSLLTFYSPHCIFQRCLRSTKLVCSVTISTVLTVGGTCNMFGVCRSGMKAQMDHPACREMTWPG
jgi:hypothetical protein